MKIKAATKRNNAFFPGPLVTERFKVPTLPLATQAHKNKLTFSFSAF